MPTVSNWVSDIDLFGCVFLWLLFAMVWPKKTLGACLWMEGLLALICQWRASWIDQQALEAS